MTIWKLPNASRACNSAQDIKVNCWELLTLLQSRAELSKSELLFGIKKLEFVLVIKSKTMMLLKISPLNNLTLASSLINATHWGLQSSQYSPLSLSNSSNFSSVSNNCMLCLQGEFNENVRIVQYRVLLLRTYAARSWPSDGAFTRDEWWQGNWSRDSVRAHAGGSSCYLSSSLIH